MEQTIYEKLVKELIGTKIPKPISETLSGHTVGEPFDKHVCNILKHLLNLLKSTSNKTKPSTEQVNISVKSVVILSL